MPIVSSLHIYPVKSCRGHSVKSFGLDRFGPIGDRRWMIVSDSPDLQFITQRTHPELANLEARNLDTHIIELSIPGMDPIEAMLSKNSGPSRTVRIWKHNVNVRDAGNSVSNWLSSFLNEKVRLVGIGPDFNRFIDAEKSNETGFADGYPLLVLSQASLDNLNNRLKIPIEMSRFRPNIVIDGCAPYEEDNWKLIKIGDAILSSSSPCSRCIMTTVDPRTGVRKGNEPLTTLARYRNTIKGVVFGQNYTNESKSGRIQTGMKIEIL